MRSKLIFSLICSMALISSASAASTDFCVSGLKGTFTNSFIFKVAHATNSERTVSLMDSNKNVVFTSKAENRFTQFNSTGYGVCSIAGLGSDAATGAQYKLEMKVNAHSKVDCNQMGIPASVEYLTLKVTPKGTTLGDDMTAYALSVVPCP